MRQWRRCFAKATISPLEKDPESRGDAMTTKLGQVPFNFRGYLLNLPGSGIRFSYCLLEFEDGAVKSTEIASVPGTGGFEFSLQEIGVRAVLFSVAFGRLTPA